MELKRVVITGLGAITPIGNDVETTWKNALDGVSGAGPITHFDASLFKTQFACEVKGFDGAAHFDRKKLRQLDLYAQYAMVAARQAVEDSGIEKEENLNRNRVGVIGCRYRRSAHLRGGGRLLCHKCRQRPQIQPLLHS